MFYPIELGGRWKKQGKKWEKTNLLRLFQCWQWRKGRVHAEGEMLIKNETNVYLDRIPLNTIPAMVSYLQDRGKKEPRQGVA